MAGNSTGGSLIGDKKLKQLYATMLQCRLFTEHAGTLPARRRALYSSSLGQEAIATGCVIDLRPQDTIALSPHDWIPSLVKGVPLRELVAPLYGRSGNPDSYNIMTLASDPAEQLQRANDVALANRRKPNANVVMAFSSIGATTMGGWHDALKLAARRSLPIVFVVENNPWNVSRSRNGTVDAPPGSKLEGLTTIVVDGNDVVAVYRVAYESLDRVRQGGGPVLIEAKTFRQDGRALLRSERDPLIHMERYLRAKKLFTSLWKKQQTTRFARDLKAAIQAANHAANQEPVL